jgi:predicted RNA binding protein YcfA (HicA-like mRNA interferase family)
MTWAELIRLLKEHGWREARTGKGAHILLTHPDRRAVIWVSRHTKKDVGTGLARRILKDAGVEQ